MSTFRTRRDFIRTLGLGAAILPFVNLPGLAFSGSGKRKQRLVVVFSPNGGELYAYRVPDPGARGTVTAARTSTGLRTYLDGPGGGLVFVAWDVPDGLVCAVTMRDLKLEPSDPEATPRR